MDRNDGEETLDGYAFRGPVQVGAIGTGASATVGAIGEGSRGSVFVNRRHAEERLFEELLDLLIELRERLDEQRDAVGDRYPVIKDNLDDLEESLDEAKPPSRIRSKLKAIEQLVGPFKGLADLVFKMLELAGRHQG
jgi:hypothetical protein